MKRLATIAVSLVAVGAISGVAPSAAADDVSPGPGGVSTSPAGNTGSDFSSTTDAASGDGTVQYWGYSSSTKQEWAADPVEADASSVTTASLVQAQATHDVATGVTTNFSAAGGAFVCALWVGNVYYKTLALRGTTQGICHGTFDSQHTGQQFQRDSWRGWLPYTTVVNGKSTSYYNDTIYWSKKCNFGGDKGGTYNYRQYAMQFAYATDGTWHHGPNEYSGKNYRGACGTGAS